MNAHRFSVLLVVGLVLSAGLATPVAADGWSDALTEDDDEEDGGLLPDVDVDVAAILAGAEGGNDRMMAWVDRQTGELPSAEAKANATTTIFNDNSEIIVDYVNQRATFSEDHEVIRITFGLGDETTTRYIVGDVNTTTGNYSSAAMLTREEYESRGLEDADVDEWLEPSGYATENAPNELQYFVNEFAEPNKDFAGSPREARAKSRYAGSIEKSFSW